MATTASAGFDSRISWNSTDDDEAVAPDVSQFQHRTRMTFAESTSRRVYAKTLTVPLGSLVLDIDLTNLEDVNNQAVSFAAVEFIKVENNNSASLDSVLVGPQGATNGWATPWDSDNDAKETLGPGDALIKTAKTDTFLVDASNKVLRFQMNGGSDDSVTLDVIIIGTA